MLKTIHTPIVRTNKLAFAKPDITQQEINAVTRVLHSGWLTSGPEVKEFELEFAKTLQVKQAVAVHSCTAALHLAVAAWDLGKNDAVLIPAITFTATAEVFSYSDCLPIILDVERDSYLLSAEIVNDFIKKKCKWQNKCLIHQSSQRQVRALVPVHLGGRPCDMDSLKEIAESYNLKILDDAAHAFPSTYKSHKIGAISDATAFSFYATKNLCTGEGGMLTTNDLELAEKVRRMRLHGIEGQTYGRKRWRYDVVCSGYKYNMSDICAALGRVQLQRSDEMLAKRQAIHQFYDQNLKELKGIRINPPCKYGSSYHLYVIEVLAESGLSRDQFVEEMYRHGIATSLHFIPLYRLSHYRKKYALQNSEKNYPNSEKIYKNMLSLPIYSSMTLRDAGDVVQAIKLILL